MNTNLQQINFSNIQHYSDRIKEVLREIDKKKNAEIDVVEYTRKITKEAYGDMKRKFGGGTYYEKHLEGVLDLVGDVITDNEDFKKFTEIIALLHDIVEDNLMSYEKLENMFSQEIRHIV